jgi:hypothetical protein
MTTTADPRDAEILADRLTVAIREAMGKGNHPNVLEVVDLPGGVTELEGTFDLSIVARACLAEIERAGLKLVKV